MAASCSLVAILLLSVVAANLVEGATDSLPEVSLSARKALNHGESAGLATTFEEAWSTLGDALKAAAQVLRGSPLIELWRNPSATNGDVTDIKSDNEYREALKKDKIVIEFWIPDGPDGHQSLFQHVYAQFADRFSGIAFYRVNIRDLPDLALKEVGIRGIPAFVAFSYGKKYDEVDNLNEVGLNNLVQKLNALG
jgi:hypothetical protein